MNVEVRRRRKSGREGKGKEEDTHKKGDRE